MTQAQLELDPGRTAVVIMDFQNRIVGNYASDQERTVERAGVVLAAARAAGARVIHVMHRGGAFEADSPDVEIHPGVAPVEGETVLRKIRAGSFSTTGLEALLREDGRDSLVLMGVATSGCVLSTVRWGADVSFRLMVVRDACDDMDAEVHRVLTEKIFPRQAEVLTADEFAARIAGG
ncbi:MAG: cysteine hydrolase [Chloroflexi bacterium]|nr:cysteine hydrolase [Chloroflexota bacterium]